MIFILSIFISLSWDWPSISAFKLLLLVCLVWLLLVLSGVRTAHYAFTLPGIVMVCPLASRGYLPVDVCQKLPRYLSSICILVQWCLLLLVRRVWQHYFLFIIHEFILKGRSVASCNTLLSESLIGLYLIYWKLGRCSHILILDTLPNLAILIIIICFYIMQCWLSWIWIPKPTC